MHQFQRTTDTLNTLLLFNTNGAEITKERIDMSIIIDHEGGIYGYIDGLMSLDRYGQMYIQYTYNNNIGGGIWIIPKSAGKTKSIYIKRNGDLSVKYAQQVAEFLVGSGVKSIRWIHYGPWIEDYYMIIAMLKQMTFDFFKIIHDKRAYDKKSEAEKTIATLESYECFTAKDVGNLIKDHQKYLESQKDDPYYHNRNNNTNTKIQYNQEVVYLFVPDYGYYENDTYHLFDCIYPRLAKGLPIVIECYKQRKPCEQFYTDLQKRISYVLDDSVKKLVTLKYRDFPPISLDLTWLEQQAEEERLEALAKD